MSCRITTILGARPQFIKAAPVSRAFAEMGIKETIIHTGQHFDRDMSDVFFEELGIPQPQHHLGVSGGGHGAMTGAMLQALELLLEAEAPDWVVVYGDTNSTLAGALTAGKLNIPVAHIEAGLRSFNRRMPEEINRILTDQLADVLFTPTDAASDNLRREGVASERILQVGDVMYDAALFHSVRAAERSAVFAAHGLMDGEYILATVHRAENTDDPIRLHAIMNGLEVVASERPVILPLHPRTRAALTREGINSGSIQFIEPLGYLDMVALESHAAVIATDSGGVQKEAYFHGVPCVTFRDETEWSELVEAGWNRIVPPLDQGLAAAIEGSVGTAGRMVFPYGDGKAACYIAKRLVG